MNHEPPLQGAESAYGAVMMVQVGYRVVEHFTDQGPEEFGMEFLDERPTAGDVVLLHWLDGSNAYKVNVLSVTEDNVLHVEAVKP